MIVIPYKTINLSSPAYIDDTVNTLKNYIYHNNEIWLVSNIHPHKKYEGYINGSKFKLRKLSQRRKQVMTPIVSGEVIKDNYQSLIKIKIHFHYIIYPVIILFLVLAVWGIINEINISSKHLALSEDLFLQEILYDELSEDELKEMERIDNELKTVNWKFYIGAVFVPYILLMWSFNKEIRLIVEDLKTELQAEPAIINNGK